jgi:hypothetical protein
MAFAPNARAERNSPIIAAATPPSVKSMRKPSRRGEAIAWAALAIALVPNDPHPAWYAIPELLCDAATSDQDQWRCDEDPVTFQRGAVPRAPAEGLQQRRDAPD